MGQNTKEFQAYKDPLLEDLSFSIIYLDRGKYRTLNFSTKDEKTRTNWVYGLNILMASRESGTSSLNDMVGLPMWLKVMWDKIDTSNTGSLDLDQITALMKTLQMHLSKREIKSYIKV